MIKTVIHKADREYNLRDLNPIFSKIIQAKNIVAISNYKTSREIEELSDKYDCILRFNSGANPKVLKDKNKFYNGRVDVAVLSGWNMGFFGDLNEFKDIPVLFSRPKKDENDFQPINPSGTFLVRNNFLDKFNHNNYAFISYQVYLDFIEKYKCIHPSSGLLTLFFIKNYLNSSIEGINFLTDEQMYNIFLNKKAHKHTFEIEKSIFSDLKIENIII